METVVKQTIECKYCKTEIPKGARICPNCKKDLGNFFVRHPIITIFVVLMVIGKMASNAVTPQGNISPAFDSSLSTGQSSSAEIERKAKEDDARKKLAGLQIVKSRVGDQYGFAHLYVTVKNNTGREIDAYTISTVLADNFNKVQHASISGDSEFSGVVQKRIPKTGSDSATWQLSLFEHATKVVSTKVTSLHFPDTNETVILP